MIRPIEHLKLAIDLAAGRIVRDEIDSSNSVRNFLHYDLKIGRKISNQLPIAINSQIHSQK